MYRQKLNDIVINKPRLSCVASKKEDKTKRIIILKETISKIDLSEIPEDLRKWILEQQDVEVINYSIHLDYNYYTANEVGIEKQ